MSNSRTTSRSASPGWLAAVALRAHSCGHWQRWQIWKLRGGRPHYRTGDEECGAIVCYTDNSSSSIGDSSIEELAKSMKLQYNSISSFLTASLLKVIDSKTHTMILTTSQLQRQRNLNLTIQIGSVRQETYSVERVLGLQLHHNLKFR